MKSPESELSSSGTRVMKMPPKMAPRTLPSPPTMIMARYSTLKSRGKWSGVTTFR